MGDEEGEPRPTKEGRGDPAGRRALFNRVPGPEVGGAWRPRGAPGGAPSHPGQRGRAATPLARRIKFVGSGGAGRRGEGVKL